MTDNYLITGYWGEPHVTAENDRGINAAMFGIGRFVLPIGQQFRAEYIGNNTIRMYDGKLIDNGAAVGIPVGEYVDLLIANAGQGKNRNDLIVFQYRKDSSTLIERGSFVVIQGEETAGTASDPVLTQEDLLSGEAMFDQMALWRVSVSGTTISNPVKMYTLHKVTAEDVGAVPKVKVLADEYVPEDITIKKEMPVLKLKNTLAPKYTALTLEHLGVNAEGVPYGGGMYHFFDGTNYSGIRLNPLSFDKDGIVKITGNEVVMSINADAYKLYGEHNKPKGSYTGTPTAIGKYIGVGGISNLLLITSDTGTALVSNRGAICHDRQGTSVVGLESWKVNYNEGILTISTDSPFVNGDQTYWYQVL